MSYRDDAARRASRWRAALDAIAGVKTTAEPLRTADAEMVDGLGCRIATPY